MKRSTTKPTSDIDKRPSKKTKSSLPSTPSRTLDERIEYLEHFYRTHSAIYGEETFECKILASVIGTLHLPNKSPLQCMTMLAMEGAIGRVSREALKACSAFKNLRSIIVGDGLGKVDSNDSDSDSSCDTSSADNGNNVGEDSDSDSDSDSDRWNYGDLLKGEAADKKSNSQTSDANTATKTDSKKPKCPSSSSSSSSSSRSSDDDDSDDEMVPCDAKGCCVKMVDGWVNSCDKCGGYFCEQCVEEHDPKCHEDSDDDEDEDEKEGKQE